MLFRTAGGLIWVTPEILGTVKDSACVLVMAGLLVLVAVTANEAGVPGGGIWPVVGTR